METVVWLIVIKNVESLLYGREFMSWKKIYSSGNKASNVILTSKSMFLSNCRDWQEV